MKAACQFSAKETDNEELFKCGKHEIYLLAFILYIFLIYQNEKFLLVKLILSEMKPKFLIIFSSEFYNAG